MGYETRYKVRIVSGSLSTAAESAIASGYATLETVVAKEACGKYGNPFDFGCSWYDHDEHMLKFSELHPNALIELSGEGEENGDVWKSYYKNGKTKSIRPEMTWPEFKEEDLV